MSTGKPRTKRMNSGYGKYGVKQAGNGPSWRPAQGSKKQVS